MANINLLPWREGQRTQHQQRFALLSVLAFLLGVGLLMIVYLFAKNIIDSQEARNRLIQQEIQAIGADIAELDGLQQEREVLIDRVGLIRQLQQQRSDIVHVFDEFPRVVPGDLYFQKMDYKDGYFSVSGAASNNREISNLMRNLDGSEWFAKPNLAQVIAKKDTKLSEFDLKFEIGSGHEGVIHEAK